MTKSIYYTFVLAFILFVFQNCTVGFDAQKVSSNEGESVQGDINRFVSDGSEEGKGEAENSKRSGTQYPSPKNLEIDLDILSITDTGVSVRVNANWDRPNGADPLFYCLRINPTSGPATVIPPMWQTYWVLKDLAPGDYQAVLRAKFVEGSCGNPAGRSGAAVANFTVETQAPEGFHFNLALNHTDNCFSGGAPSRDTIRASAEIPENTINYYDFCDDSQSLLFAIETHGNPFSSFQCKYKFHDMNYFKNCPYSPDGKYFFPGSRVICFDVESSLTIRLTKNGVTQQRKLNFNKYSAGSGNNCN